MRNWTSMLAYAPITLVLALPLAVAMGEPPSQARTAPSVSATQPRDSPTGRRVARTWAPTYMADAHVYSRSEAVAVARRFDLVVAMPIAFAPHVAAMRATNPRLRILAYSNATLAVPGTVGGLPESAFAHDLRGHRIVSARWGSYLMEPSSPAWRRAATRQCRHRAALGGYDGCLVDMMTLGIFSRGLVGALPVVPGTGRVYSEWQYRDQLLRLGRRYTASTPGLDLVANVMENGYRYWAAPVTSRPLALRMPGAQMEDFLRGAGDPVTSVPVGADWRRDFRVVRDLGRHHVLGLFTTKLWVGASRAQVARWQAYAMATFLLGSDGRSYFAFTSSRTRAGATGADLPYRMPKRLGASLRPARLLESGAMKRRFEHGVAVVNPTRHWSEVHLGRSYRTLGGRRVHRLTLAPGTGDVLVAR